MVDPVRDKPRRLGPGGIVRSAGILLVGTRIAPLHWLSRVGVTEAIGEGLDAIGGLAMKLTPLKHISAFGLGSALFAGAAQAQPPIVRSFEFVGGDETLLVGTLPDADVRAVAAGAPMYEMIGYPKVLLATPELGIGHQWVVVQLSTTHTCNVQGCRIRILHSSPAGYVTVADVMASDVAWIDDDHEPPALIFISEAAEGDQETAIWRWNGSGYAFDQLGDEAMMDAYTDAITGVLR